MNQLTHLLTYALILSSLSCNKKQETDEIPNADSVKIIKPQQEKTTTNLMDKNLIKKIDSKQEIRNDGDYNQMTLFEVKEDISLEQIKSYCSSVKPNYNNGYFQILVFFKKPNSARFPDNPLTALHNDEKDSKNIKAVYTINNINGYSKLDYYENNSFESLAQSIEIQ
ncbi:hypothetical protein [Chryseobacterium indoltheticum]|uniref:Uncharacterized protein n=1 Tax=Chryseobacterium indoltheticum TaxID=254 RepID=A0A381F542_9FLAO|nr:hypothetical protein [Chryseobacterium indoltheticum]AZA75105.1 hypothetical protein EG358_15615 [Chryseobacterium indoltheticum]SIQ55449.1 hypothetical protein SAMN05421682_10667 [Chryseobacterium indoltheticum]SUX41574.1 Uncharacterised protein [Chryseobacterium indoltheticum]